MEDWGESLENVVPTRPAVYTDFSEACAVIPAHFASGVLRVDLARHLLCTGCWQVWRERVENLDVLGMLTKSCDGMRVGAVKSTIEQDITQMGCFAGKQFEKRMVIGYYSGTRI